MLSLILTAGAAVASPALGSATSKAEGSVAAVSLARELHADGAQNLTYYLRLRESDDSDEQARAFTALAQFNHADAFAALQAGLNLGNEGHAAPITFTAETIEAVRCAAAQGLARSPYPHARTYLRRFEDDPSPRIRMIVLKMVGARAPHSPADLTFLRRKTIDPDPQVASEATQRLRAWRS